MHATKKNYTHIHRSTFYIYIAYKGEFEYLCSITVAPMVYISCAIVNNVVET